jgi:hypothetical protein
MLFLILFCLDFSFIMMFKNIGNGTFNFVEFERILPLAQLESINEFM